MNRHCIHGFPEATEHGWTNGAGERWICVGGVMAMTGVDPPRRSWWRRLMRRFGQ